MKKSVLRSLTILSGFLILFTSTLSFAVIPVAVVDFTASKSSNRTIAQKLSGIIGDKLVNTGDFEVVEREKLSSALQEFNFQGSAFVNPEAAVEMGGMIGAQLLITGDVIQYWAQTSTSTAYNITTKSTKRFLKAKLEIIDLKTGVKIFSSISEGSVEAKKTGSNVVGAGQNTLLEKVSNRLVTKMMDSKRVKKMVAAANAASEEIVTITINSEPKGADVEIDGTFVGNAGGTFEVSAGVHDISITLPGYIGWQKSVRVKEGMSFTARLSKKEAKSE